ncbi:MAG: DUF4832 domain-containing protein, partial [Bacteroidota bacterium]
FKISLQIENVGYASPFNPRPVQLILRNKQTQAIITFHFKTSIQKWFTGKINLRQQFTLPRSATKGEYELLLNLPDGYKNLQNYPAYSIHFANDDMWEEATGYNNLKHTFILQ